MNPFILMSIIFAIILTIRILLVYRKRYWNSASVLITDTVTETDVNGCIHLHISFTYDDRQIHNDTITVTEEFTDLSSTTEKVQHWLFERGIRPGERVKLFYNPRNVEQTSFQNRFCEKDHSQIVIWSSITMMSLIIGLLVSR